MSHLHRQHGFWLLSPYAAIACSAAIALVSFLIPPAAYRSVMREENYAFLHTSAAAFVGLCIAAFIVGLLVSSRFTPAPFASYWSERRLATARALYLICGVPLAIALMLVVVRLAQSISLTALVLAFSLQQGGLEVSLSAVEHLSGLAIVIPLVATAFAALGLWLVQTMPPTGRRRVLAITLGVLVAGILFVYLLTLKRRPLLTVATSLLLVRLLWLYAQGRMKYRSAAKYFVPFVVIGVLYFAFAQMVRTVDDRGRLGSSFESALMGYYPGSFNRLSQIVDGRLRLGSPGGYYWTQPLWNMPLASRALGLDRTAQRVFVDPPRSGATDRTWAISAAGLRRNFTSVTAFGMSYVDFGWLGFLPFIPYGIITGILWHAFLRADPAGLVLYPPLLFSILEWRGYLEIARHDMWVLAALALGLSVLVRTYDRPGRPT